MAGDAALGNQIPSGEAQPPGAESVEVVRTPESVVRSLEEVDTLLESLVACWNDPQRILQQRRRQRFPFRREIRVTPLNEQTGEPMGPPFLATGRDISLGGISFVHERPLPFRLVAVMLPSESGEPQSLVTRLNWCRFNREGLYQSGGPFLRVVEPGETL